MAAYVIVDIVEIHDEETYAAYRAQASPGLVDAGGRYLARGGPIEVLEGTWTPKRIVLVRFDSMDAARRWWASAQYADLKGMRQRATKTHMIVVDGLFVADE